MSFSQRTSWFQQRPVWFHQLLTFATSSINRHSQDRICTPHMWSQNGACKRVQISCVPKSKARVGMRRLPLGKGSEHTPLSNAKDKRRKRRARNTAHPVIAANAD